ncbi:hypothetical protein R5R35_003044 [Gryllus longicercus]|uniref:Uncharacterized protein n=2 Tax=Gryllus longicercus TaxID=2509291 RepID=A0AAN9VXD0_9ORTH
MMKHTTPSFSSSLEHLTAKMKSYPNGSAGKKYNLGKNTKGAFDVKKISRKVHSNINFSKLDEVCLDVGKVDLSCSARLRNDSGLSPLKGPREWNGEIHELESLESTGKSTFGIRPQVSSSMFRGAEDEEWKGWRSSISFSQQHCCPLVRITEGSKVSEVLVMDEDLVDGECKILEKRNGYKLNRSKLKSSVLGTCESGSGKKSCEEENFELKEKLQELFEDTGELHNFCECIDFSVSSPQFLTRQNKPFIRKLNFSGGEIDVPSTSNCSVGASRERSDPNVCSNCVHDTKKFLGFSDGARFLSQNYARGFLDFYDIQNGITM